MDLIERQKAIDALANTKDLVDVTWTDENDNVIDSIEEKRNIIANWLEKVPAAQPEIIRCKGCKKWHTNCRPVCGKHGCDVISDYTKPDDFCAWAERRQE